MTLSKKDISKLALGQHRNISAVLVEMDEYAKALALLGMYRHASEVRRLRNLIDVNTNALASHIVELTK
jgi:hypothetical protein